jgi:hypothetical protein
MTYEKLDQAVKDLVRACNKDVEDITLTLRISRKHPEYLEGRIQVNNKKFNSTAPGLDSSLFIKVRL